MVGGGIGGGERKGDVSLSLYLSVYHHVCLSLASKHTHKKTLHLPTGATHNALHISLNSNKDMMEVHITAPSTAMGTYLKISVARTNDFISYFITGQARRELEG